MTEPLNRSDTRRFTRGRLLLLAAMVAAVVAVYLSGVTDYLRLDTLNARRVELLDFVAGNRPAAIGAFVAVLFSAVALSIPGAGLLTIIGGFMFGPLLAAVLVIFSATAGGTVVFLVARYVIGDALRARASPTLRRIEAGFNENALSYLLALRLMPVFPFFLITLGVAFTAMSARTFALGTFLGIIPASLIYATLGAGLNDALEAGAADPLTAIQQPTVIGGLMGLALLALLPVVYKKLANRS